MKVYNKGTQMNINQKRTFLSHGNLHFIGSWRLEKFNETQRKYNVFILDELINITRVSSINHHYIDKQPNLFTSVEIKREVLLHVHMNITAAW
jgi:hypothetical protein